MNAVVQADGVIWTAKCVKHGSGPAVCVRVPFEVVDMMGLVKGQRCALRVLPRSEARAPAGASMVPEAVGQAS